MRFMNMYLINFVLIIISKQKCISYFKSHLQSVQMSGSEEKWAVSSTAKSE